MLLSTLHVPVVIYAAKPSEQYHTLKENLSQLFVPKSSDDFKVAKMHKLSNFKLDRSIVQEFPTVQLNDNRASSFSNLPSRTMTLQDAVKIAIQRSPDISQSIATLAGQNSGVDVAKAGYYPQLSGGITTGDLSSGERGRQLLTLSATQMLYDFGKVKSGVEVAKAQKQQTRLTRYPTLAVKGSVSQAINGKNPNNDKDDGLYSSVMLEATSQFYQGGATASQVKMASYAEEAAKAKVNSVYMDVLDQIRTSREQIENKQRQMQVLASRQATTVRTRELYQEQYKLGTRSLVDLLNAEQAIHSANSELESARYDIYSSIVQYIEATGRSRQAYGLNNISIQGFEVQP
ncbi:TolC family protein [Acinetobacter baumannii]